MPSFSLSGGGETPGDLEPGGHSCDLTLLLLAETPVP